MMFSSTSTNNRINHLQERALRLVYDNYPLIFGELLEKDGSFTFHYYNIQTCIELYKVYHNMSQTIFSELFTRNNITYNMRSKSDFDIPQVSTVFKGSSSISYYGPITWSLVPEKIRSTRILLEVCGSLRIVLVVYAKVTSLMLDFYKHLNSTFRKKEVLFIIFDSFDICIKRLSLTVARLSWLSITIFLYN